ncbi:shikimate dehydrogenase [Leucobacter sp. CSA1]|uniref:Shikimate dehydrogenase n=1 Tax=Leucobacter chromiisoli TaxID=2796471 RepID=A0A934Q7Q3_9MICO|nr:shikimate dehydrogenase [Leucobacter chromiisoli]MBK0418377.1 shikimate dehydrogenase [Leucobacter chromiisoli]
MTTQEQYPTLTAAVLRPAVRPTFYFIGVSTAHSSIRQVFPEWADELGLGEVDFVGIDMPLHAPAEDYRRVVQFFRDDALSVGALVTTHKLDLYQAASDLFDYADPLTVLMDEISCISKRDGELRAHAKDPITAGFAIDAILPPGSWKGRSTFIMGAGGSAIAMAWHLTRPERGDDVPREIVVSNRSRPRLESLREVYRQFGTEVPLRLVDSPAPADNDAALALMPPGSLIVNATGLGKDAPGSPLSDAGVFPEAAHVWDLNYRGDLVFLDQARAQAEERGLRIHDGWVYFIHGWTRVIAEVFDIEIPTSGPGFDRLSAIARGARRA